ncbi:DHA2 family efflux MFS transporter permease subunit [Lacibacterium aquatile]|uniref:DHA2 family efflux MFS transporter permease subunit n=1 Tax=Lacibacterium aquatile TaxID=1168082 RepID=A0ABW5DSY0_9PROT
MSEASTPSPKRRWVPIVVACALFMENLDGTIINTALPEIARDMGVSPLSLSAAVTSYLLSLALFIPVSGWATDRFGARRIFSAAIIAFLLGSIVCGFATGPMGLVIGRTIQGIGGAMMAPVGRIVLLRSFPKAELMAAMTYVTMPALIGPAVGPLLGGFLATYANWRWIFFVNIPIGILGVVLAWKLFDDDRPVAAGRFDTVGFILIGGGLAAFMWGMETIGRAHLPISFMLGLIFGGLALMALYVWHSRRIQRPALDLSPLKIPTFRMAVVGGTIVRIGFGCTPFLLPLFYQLGLGYSAMESGTYTFIIGLGALSMKVVATRFARWVGFRRILMFNGLVVGAITLLFTLFDASTPYWVMLATLGIYGFVRSLQFTSLNALGFADLPPEMAAGGAAVQAVGQQLSVALGVALAAALLLLLGGGHPDLSDFRWTFAIVALLPMASIVIFARMKPEDGSAVSGHGR